MYLQRDKGFVKWWDYICDALLPLKQLSHKVTQLISLSFEKSTNDFWIVWYVVNKLALFASFASNDSKASLRKEVALAGFSPALIIFHRIL